MKLAFLHFLLPLIYVSDSCKNPKKLSDCDVIPLSFSECDDTEGYWPYKFNLKTVDDDGGKRLDFNVDLPEDFTEGFNTSIKIDQFSDGEWKEIFNNENRLCDILDEYAPGVWKAFKEAIEPPIFDNCFASSGYYELTDFEAHTSYFDIPVAMCGKFKVEVKLLTEDRTEVACQLAEIQVDE